MMSSKSKRLNFLVSTVNKKKRDENENGINDRIVCDYYVVRLSRKEKNTTENLIVYNKNKKKKTLLKSMGTGNPHVMTNFLSSVWNNKKPQPPRWYLASRKRKRNVQVFIHVILFVFSNKCAANSTGIYTRKKRIEKCFVCFHAGQKGQNWNFILSRRKSRVRKSKTAKLFGKLPSTWVKVFSLIRP